MNVKNQEFLSFKEVQKLLGVSKSTLYKLTAGNKIPHYKPTNGKLFFETSELFNWISGNASQKIQERSGDGN